MTEVDQKGSSGRHLEFAWTNQAINDLVQLLPNGLYHPVLRANPFPEDTDLFCRIPLSTLFYRPEAANLGDLMRLWVRSGVQIKLAVRFSWIVKNAPNTP